MASGEVYSLAAGDPALPLWRRAAGWAPGAAAAAAAPWTGEAAVLATVRSRGAVHVCFVGALRSLFTRRGFESMRKKMFRIDSMGREKCAATISWSRAFF